MLISQSQTPLECGRVAPSETHFFLVKAYFLFEAFLFLNLTELICWFSVPESRVRHRFQPLTNEPRIV